MSDPRRGPEKPRSNRTAVIVGVAVAAAFLVYMLAYGFGGFLTPGADEQAEDAPTTEQPVDDFAADEPDDAAEGGQPPAPTAEPGNGAGEDTTAPAQ